MKRKKWSSGRRFSLFLTDRGPTQGHGQTGSIIDPWTEISVFCLFVVVVFFRFPCVPGISPAFAQVFRTVVLVIIPC